MNIGSFVHHIKMTVHVVIRQNLIRHHRQEQLRDHLPVSEAENVSFHNISFPLHVYN